MTTFLYDLAFSFLAQDEPLALELDALLSERLRVFVYSTSQAEVAGTDGEETFTRVFGAESRVVAVLHRAGWGDTSWTRIEQTAIRNRAYDSGYDFAVFIPVDKAPLPPWVPKTRIWIGLDRSGPEGAATVLKARVAEAGGEPKVETAVTRAARLARQAAAEQERSRFLESQAGVNAAHQELDLLFREVERLVGEINALGGAVSIRVERRDRQLCLHSEGKSMTVAWSLQWANTLKHSSLYIKLWMGPVSLVHPSRARELSTVDFDFERLASLSVGWREAHGKKRFLSTVDLADAQLKRFLDALQ